MRKVVVSEYVSLDGVMEDPGGAEGFEHGGWVFQFDRGPEGDKFKLDEVLASDALLSCSPTSWRTASKKGLVVATFKGWRPEDIRLIGSRASVMVGDRPSERNRDGEQS